MRSSLWKELEKLDDELPPQPWTLSPRGGGADLWTLFASMPTNHAAVLHYVYDKKAYETIIGVKTLRRNGNSIKESLVNTIFSTSHLLDIANTPVEAPAIQAGSTQTV